MGRSGRHEETELRVTWKPKDARKYSNDVATFEKRKLWAEIANDELGKTGDEGYAIRAANEAVKHRTRIERWRIRLAKRIQPWFR